MRILLKKTLFSAYATTLDPPLRWLRAGLGRQHVAVLVYHRVTDKYRDAVTVGVAQFDEQMQFLTDNCGLVTLTSLLNGRIDWTSSQPMVAVTFDDGYLDNYENAVPIMAKHRVTAAFFVSTGKIDDQSGFEHDRRRLGENVPVMTWDQLREMSSMGHCVGSHTVSHVNCAQTPLNDLRRELEESKRRLEEELRIGAVMFAYPFGGRADINSAAIQLVKEVGYTACLSAYGGVNRKNMDPFNIRRVGIGSNYTRSALRARIQGI